MSWGDTDVSDKNKGYYKIGDSVVVKFSKMDKPVYDFWESKILQIQNGGNPFASPTTIPTNISGGAIGVWAGFSPWYDTLVCAP